jgi:hypothetical protein
MPLPFHVSTSEWRSALAGAPTTVSVNNQEHLMSELDRLANQSAIT